MADVPEVTAQEGRELVDGGAFLLDVREPNEWVAGRAVGAVHIPVGDVEGRIGDVPGDRQVVVICRSGVRSANVTAFLNQRGLDAVNLAGGTQAWAQLGFPMEADGDAPPQVV